MTVPIIYNIISIQYRHGCLNLIHLQALSLVGPTVTRRVLDPLAILSFNNRLYIIVWLGNGTYVAKGEETTKCEIKKS